MRIRTLALAGLLALGATTPAQASDVTVRFALSAGTYAPTGAACELSVPEGASGLAVLDAAVARACIVSYATESYPEFGTFVTCIDFVCGQALTATHGTYWNMYDGGGSASYGVDGFVATDGAELGFAYQVYCFDAICPPV
jgi:hypothetical protein